MHRSDSVVKQVVTLGEFLCMKDTPHFLSFIELNLGHIPCPGVITSCQVILGIFVLRPPFGTVPNWSSWVHNNCPKVVFSYEEIGVKKDGK